MSRFIFLDIDGVLNSADTISRDVGPFASAGEHRLSMLDLGMCVRFAGLLYAAPDARVVLSSTWRLLHTAQEMAALIVKKLTDGGHSGAADAIKQAIVDGVVVPRFIGRTGETALMGTLRRTMGRGCEIQAWLEVFTPDPLAQHVAILDDDSDMGLMSVAHVATSWMTGLLPEHCTAVLEKLSHPLSALPGFEGLSERTQLRAPGDCCEGVAP